MSEVSFNVRLGGDPRDTGGTGVTVSATVTVCQNIGPGQACLTAGATSGRTDKGYPIRGWSVDLSGTLPISAGLQLEGSYGYQRFEIENPKEAEPYHKFADKE